MVKSLVIILTFLVCTFSVYGEMQKSDTINDILTFTFLSESPYYIVRNSITADVDSLKNFISKNLNYHESALRDSIDGTVHISFWIDIDGQTIEHEIIRGVREDIDNEAIRVARLIVFEKPAMQKGKPVKVQYTIPIHFNYGKNVENNSIKKRKR